MNGGILRTALTKQVPLELDYRESSLLSQNGADFEQPIEVEAGVPYTEQRISEEFACLLSAI